MISFQIGTVHLLCLLTVCRAMTHEEQIMAKHQDIKFITVTRPVFNDSDPVNVTFDIALQQIIKLDEKQETLLISLRQILRWTEVRVTWNANDHNGIDVLHMPIGQLWRPDIVLLNSVHEEDVSNRPLTTYALVTSDGTVTWSYSGLMTSSCSINIQWFPFDEQSCELRFGSLTYDVNEIMLQPIRNKIDTSLYQKNNQWRLKYTEVELKRDVNSSHTFIIYRLILTRQSRHYVINLIAPSFLLSILVLFTFYLPVQSGQKLPFGVIVLLCLCLYQLVLANIIPTMSSCLPIISTYLCLLTSLCVVSIIMTVLVLNVHYTQPHNSCTPHWVRVGVCQCLAWLLCMKCESKDKKVSRVKLRSYKPSMIYHVTASAPTELPASSEQVLLDDQHLGVVRQRSHQTDVSPDTQAVLEQLSFITDKIREDMDERELKEEWQFAARVIDRLCLCICSFIFIVGVSGVFILMASERTTAN